MSAEELSKITVRRVRAEELGVLQAIEASSFARTWNADRLLQLAYGPFSGVLAAAEEADVHSSPCGFLAYRVRGRKFHVQTVAVDESFRGRGVGRKLMETALRLAGEGGA